MALITCFHLPAAQDDLARVKGINCPPESGNDVPILYRFERPVDLPNLSTNQDFPQFSITYSIQ